MAMWQIHTVQLLLIAAGLAASDPDPVVIIPGFASSVLDANLTNRTEFRDCATTSPEYCIYASVQQFALRLDCMINNMALHWDRTSQCAISDRGVNIQTRDFGGLEGVAAVNPDDPSVTQVRIFAKLINNLTKTFGYKAGVSIRGAPYDFRLYGDPCYTPAFFATLQSLLEETYTLNQARAVRIICHSMGCALTNVFLGTLSAQWKDRYISGVIALAGAFAGAPDVIQSLITGPVEGGITPVVLSNKLGKATSTWPGLVTLLPSQLGELTVYSNSFPLVKLPSRSYTVAEMSDLVADVTIANTTLSSDSLNRTLLLPFISTHLWNSSEPMGVTLDCFYANDRATPISWVYSKDDFSDGGKVDSEAPGDGTVTTDSVEIPCHYWRDESAETVNCVPLELGVPHMDVPANDVIIANVLRILDGTTRAAHDHGP